MTGFLGGAGGASNAGRASDSCVGSSRSSVQGKEQAQAAQHLQERQLLLQMGRLSAWATPVQPLIWCMPSH